MTTPYSAELAKPAEIHFFCVFRVFRVDRRDITRVVTLRSCPHRTTQTSQSSQKYITSACSACSALIVVTSPGSSHHDPAHTVQRRARKARRNTFLLRVPRVPR